MQTPLLNMLACAALLLAADGLAAEVAVIAHPAVSSERLDADTVQAFFLGKKKAWTDGTRVVPVLNDNPAVHGPFLEIYVHKSPRSYTSYWKRLVFTGKSAMPGSGTDDAAVVALVAATPGAVGYVEAGSVGEGVKRLAIE